MFLILSVFPSACLFYGHRADFSIKVGSTNNLSGAMGVEVVLNEEIKALDHV